MHGGASITFSAGESAAPTALILFPRHPQPSVDKVMEGSLLTTDPGAPHLARFSRDVGYHESRPLDCSCRIKAWSDQLRYPTSREKRARCGAPGVRGKERSFHHLIQEVLTQTLPGRLSVYLHGAYQIFSAGDAMASTPALQRFCDTLHRSRVGIAGSANLDGSRPR